MSDELNELIEVATLKEIRTSFDDLRIEAGNLRSLCVEIMESSRAREPYCAGEVAAIDHLYEKFQAVERSITFLELRREILNEDDFQPC
jgi:hypothetical protein